MDLGSTYINVMESPLFPHSKDGFHKPVLNFKKPFS